MTSRSAGRRRGHVCGEPRPRCHCETFRMMGPSPGLPRLAASARNGAVSVRHATGHGVGREAPPAGRKRRSSRRLRRFVEADRET